MAKHLFVLTPPERRLRLFAMAVIAIYPLIHLAQSPPHLYADGTNFFLNILDRYGFHAFDKPRFFVQVLSQLPLVGAISFGERSLSTLGLIFSATLLILPGWLWLAASALQLETVNFWRITSAYAITYIPGSLFAIGEFNICIAVNALIFSLLLLENDKVSKLKYAGAIALLSAINTLSYEGNIMIAPIAIILIAWKIYHISKPYADAPVPGTSYAKHMQASRSKDGNRSSRALLFLSIFFYVIAIIVALLSILFPRSPENASEALRIRSLATYLPLILVAYLPIALACLHGRHKLLAIYIGFINLFTFKLYATNFLQNPGLSHAGRSTYFIGFLCLMIIPTATIYKACINPKGKSRIVYSCASLMLLISIAGMSMIRSYKFGKWANAYRSTVIQLSTSKPIDKTALWIGSNGNYIRFRWVWNNEQLSFLLAPRSPYAITNPSDYEGFEPRIKKVSLYGVDGYMP
jgi:hypothetical protein